jgi:hypothetical protein
MNKENQERRKKKRMKALRVTGAYKKKSKSQRKPKGPYPTPQPPYGIWHMVELVENDCGSYLSIPIDSIGCVEFKYVIRFEFGPFFTNSTICHMPYGDDGMAWWCMGVHFYPHFLLQIRDRLSSLIIIMVFAKLLCPFLLV